jgi:hypothetical protein
MKEPRPCPAPDFSSQSPQAKPETRSSSGGSEATINIAMQEFLGGSKRLERRILVGPPPWLGADPVVLLRARVRETVRLPIDPVAPETR